MKARLHRPLVQISQLSGYKSETLGIDGDAKHVRRLQHAGEPTAHCVLVHQEVRLVTELLEVQKRLQKVTLPTAWCECIWREQP